MQLCCNYQLIELLENRHRECIYFDSNFNCSSKRLQEISENISSMYSEYNISSKDILQNISIYYPNDLLSLLTNIISLTKETKSIKLIVIDSIPSFYKKTDFDTSIKLQTLATLIQTLSQLAYSKHCSIVVVNHLTTKEIDKNYINLNFSLMNEYPFYFTKTLGVSFSTFIKLTLYLFQSEDSSKMIIHSSTSLENPIVSFLITENGFE